MPNQCAWHTLDIFKLHFLLITFSCFCGHRFTNLCKKQQKALKELKHREDIVITNAVKEGAVIVDVKDYIKESERQINNSEQYKHLENDPTTENNATANKVITRFKNDKFISSNVSDGLKVESPRTSHFYIQPKIHKEGSTGNPVKMSLNCHTSKISEYVDFHLLPIIKQISSYVKDTIDFLRKLEVIKFVLGKVYLISLDVKSLNTTIPSAEGKKAVNLQIKGCAMEKICAPPYVNIFMDHFEKKYIYPFLQGISLIYLRFIDDIFFI